MSISKLAKRVGQVASDMGNSVRQAFRGKVNVVNSEEPIQRLQLSGLADETLQDLELMQSFGFTSNPPAETEAIVIPLGGATTHGIVIATENGNFRIKSLQPGEVAVYNESGASITLKKGKIINIDCSALNITAPDGVDIKAPNVQCSAQITAMSQINGNGGLAIKGGNGATFQGNVNQTDGNYTTNGDVIASGKSYLKHLHNGDSGGQTSPPI